MVTNHDNAQATVEAELRALIAVAPPGRRLPSVRDLVGRHRVSPVTVQRVITALAREGVVDPRPGHGTFVVHPAPFSRGDVAWQDGALAPSLSTGRELDELLAPERDGMIPMATGYPDPSLQPRALLAAAAGRVIKRESTWDRMPREGVPELRRWFATDIGAGFDADDVVIAPGGQAALSTIVRTLVPAGGVVVTQSPTYQGFLDIARLAGIRVASVGSDADGVRPDVLADVLRRTRARLVYLQPRLANPTGSTLSAERRAVVVDILRSARAFAIEDDYARDLDWGQPTRPLAAGDPDGHLIYVRSLTKTTSPSLRVAAIAARGPVRARLRSALAVDEFFVSGLLQHTAVELVSQPEWARHVTRLREALRRRMSTLVEGLRSDVAALRPVSVPSGGFALWVSLPTGADEDDVVTRARGVGVELSAGHRWHAAEPDGAHLRLSVARVDDAAIRVAVERLAGLDW